MKTIFKYTLTFILTIIWVCSLFCHDKTSSKPLKYLIHKKTINILLVRFDSITSSSFLSIGKTTDRTSVHIIFNNKIKFIDKVVTLQADSISAISKELGIDYEKINEIISLLLQTRMRSIKTLTVDNVKRVELFIEYNFFSENGRGLVYLPDKYKIRKVKKPTTKIEEFIHLDRHISF